MIEENGIKSSIVKDPRFPDDWRYEFAMSDGATVVAQGKADGDAPVTLTVLDSKLARPRASIEVPARNWETFIAKIENARKPPTTT